MRATLILHLTALVLLAAGLLLPWVMLDSPAERRANFAHLETIAGGKEMPLFIQKMLTDRGLSPGLSPERLWSLIGRDDHPRLFDFVAERGRLFCWDFLRVPTSLSVKGVVVAGLLAFLLGLGSLWTRRPISTGMDDRSPFRISPFRACLIGGCAATALLIVVNAPLLDSFGFVDQWGVAWLDALSGAQVTIAPRAFVPLGLLILAGALAMPDRVTPMDEFEKWDDESSSGRRSGHTR